MGDLIRPYSISEIFDRPTALVAEDSLSTRKLEAQHLRQIGFDKVIEARDGAEAMLLIHPGVNLVMSDWIMPGVDGLELFRRLKAAGEPLASIPFILVTMQQAQDEILTALRAGITDYIVKPFTKEILEEKIWKIFKPLADKRRREVEKMQQQVIWVGPAPGNGLEKPNADSELEALLATLPASPPATSTFPVGGPASGFERTVSQPPSPAPEQIVTPAPAGVEVGGASELPVPAPKAPGEFRIAVVEDSLSIRRMVSAALQEIEGVTVIEAGDGFEALMRIGPDTDLVLCDWMLPEIDGLTLFRKIRDQGRLFAGIPFIMVTSKHRESDFREAISAGVSDYVVKPFGRETLFKKVAKFLPQLAGRIGL